MSDVSPPSGESSDASRTSDEGGSFGKRVTKSFAYAGLGSGLAKAGLFIAVLAAFRGMSPSQIGVGEMVLTYYAISLAITELGLGVALVQAKDTSAQQLRALFWLSVLVACGGYALLASLIAPVSADFFDMPQLTALLRVHGLTLIFAAGFSVSKATLVKRLRFGRISIVENISMLAAVGTIVYFIGRGQPLWGIIVGDVVNRGCQFLAYQVFAPYVSRPTVRFASIAPMIRFGLHATGSRLLYNIYITADYFVIAKVFDDVVLGLYATGYRLTFDPLKQTIGIVNQVAYPTFARLQDDLVRLRFYFFTMARGSLVLLGTALLLVAVHADWILELFGFSHLLEAVPYVRVFAIIGVVRCVSPLVPQLLNAAGQSANNFRYSLVTAILMPVAFFVGSFFGVEGVVWAWVIAYPVVVLVLFHFARGVLEVGWSPLLARSFAGLRVVLPAAACSVGLRMLLDSVWGASWPSLVLGVLGTLAASTGFAWIFEADTLRAFRQARAEAKKKKARR